MKHIIAIFFILITCMSINAEVRIHMEKEAGVYKVPCSVNGLKLKFIFDTGAASVCISQTYAEMMLENGYLDESDLLGTSQSVLADGRTVDNVVINLRTVEIGGLTLNDVSAIVVPTQNAPLLLGQSVIQRLGKVSIEGQYLVIHNANNYTEKELDAIYVEAEEMYENEVFSKALEYYEIIYNSYGDETNPWVLYKMGICYTRLGDENSSKQCYLKAIELDDGNNEDGVLYRVYRILGAKCFLEKEYTSGLEYAKLALKYANDDNERIGAYTSIGMIYETLQKYTESIPIYDKIISGYNKILTKRELTHGERIGFVHAHTSKAQALLSLYKFKEAIQVYNYVNSIVEQYENKYNDDFRRLKFTINDGLSRSYDGLSIPY